MGEEGMEPGEPDSGSQGGIHETCLTKEDRRLEEPSLVSSLLSSLWCHLWNLFHGAQGRV